MKIATCLPSPGEEIKFWEEKADNTGNLHKVEIQWISDESLVILSLRENDEKEKRRFGAFLEIFKSAILYEIIGAYSQESMKGRRSQNNAF